MKTLSDKPHILTGNSLKTMGGKSISREELLARAKKVDEDE